MLGIAIKRILANTARNMAPEDTGNLRWNAIRPMWWTNPDKFRIKYDVSSAPYIVPLEEGWESGGEEHNIHKHFIKMTADQLGLMLDNYFNKGKQLKYVIFEDNAGLEQVQRRIERYTQSIDRYKMLREAGVLE